MKYLFFIQILLFFIILGCCFYPIIYWTCNPTLTTMQIAEKFWWLFLFVFSIVILSVYLDNKDQPRF